MKNILHAFLKGILAGMAIALGGFLFLLFSFWIPGELGKALGSLLFAIGLFLVCTFGLSLYTGKIGLIYERKQETSFYLCLPVMLIGNAAGAIALGYLCYGIFKDTALFETALAASNSRLALSTFNDYFGLCLKSMLCGFCVYMAVKLFALDRLKPLGIFGLVFFVFLFVYCGFQHCVANMFYFGFANAYGQGLTYANLGLCILFNSIGPILGLLVMRVAHALKAAS